MMFYRKKGLPQESEIVVCTVTKVQYHSVFVSLDEYDNKSAMLHISEVSPGRIRNINDYVKKDKVIICKILQINEKNGHIDVSLRRVTESQRREKVDLIKQEQKSEKIVEYVAKEHKIEPKKLYTDIFKIVNKQYDYLHEAFNEVVTDDFDLKKLKLSAKITQQLEEVIKQRIKPPEVSIKAKIHIECYAANGIEIIKNILTSILDLSKEVISIHYLGGGNYFIKFIGEDYEELEQYYSEMNKILEAQDKDFIYKLQRV